MGAGGQALHSAAHIVGGRRQADSEGRADVENFRFQMPNTYTMHTQHTHRCAASMARSLLHTYVFHAMRTARAEGERAPCVRADCSVRGLSGSRGLGGLSTSSSRRCRSGVLVGEIGRGGGRRCGSPERLALRRP